MCAKVGVLVIDRGTKGLTWVEARRAGARGCRPVQKRSTIWQKKTFIEISSFDDNLNRPHCNTFPSYSLVRDSPYSWRARLTIFFLIVVLFQYSMVYIAECHSCWQQFLPSVRPSVRLAVRHQNVCPPLLSTFPWADYSQIRSRRPFWSRDLSVKMSVLHF